LDNEVSEEDSEACLALTINVDSALDETPVDCTLTIVILYVPSARLGIDAVKVPLPLNVCINIPFK